MGFKSGKEWNGNSKGRPPVPDFRAEFTKEFVESTYDKSLDLVDRVYDYALSGEKWAYQLWFSQISPYSLIKPKTEVDIGSTNKVVSETTETLAKLSPEKIAEIGKIIYGND